jgi:hypothetical protein
VYTERVNKQTNKQTEFLMIITAMNGEYGAPAGRVDKKLETEELCRAMPIVLFDGYDYGGAYWGNGQPLWGVIDKDGDARYVRAVDQEDAFTACDIEPEFQCLTLNRELAIEYLTHLVWANCMFAAYDEADDYDDDYDDDAADDSMSVAQYATESACGAIKEDREYTLSQIRAIADCY